MFKAKILNALYVLTPSMMRICGSFIMFSLFVGISSANVYTRTFEKDVNFSFVCANFAWTISYISVAH